MDPFDELKNAFGGGEVNEDDLITFSYEFSSGITISGTVPIRVHRQLIRDPDDLSKVVTSIAPTDNVSAVLPPARMTKAKLS